MHISLRQRLTFTGRRYRLQTPFRLLLESSLSSSISRSTLHRHGKISTNIIGGHTINANIFDTAEHRSLRSQTFNPDVHLAPHPAQLWSRRKSVLQPALPVCADCRPDHRSKQAVREPLRKQHADEASGAASHHAARYTIHRRRFCIRWSSSRA